VAILQKKSPGFIITRIMILDTQTLIYILGGLGAIAIILLLWIIRLEVRIHRLLRGKNAKTLEDTIFHLGNEITTLHGAREEIEKYLTEAERRIRRSIQGISTVRFNPFKGTGGGGNQSFATAIIDEDGNGVVLSSLYSRDRVSMYAKPVIKYKSEYELTKEERDAIMKAKIS